MSALCCFPHKSLIREDHNLMTNNYNKYENCFTILHDFPAFHVPATCFALRIFTV